MLKLTSLFLLLIFANIAHSQTPKVISSDRPGLSDGPDVVGTAVFQLQSGIDFQDNGASGSDTVVNSNVLRYGLSEKVELRANFSLLSVESPGSDQQGIDDVAVGGRVNLIDQTDGWVPALGLQTLLLLPIEGTFTKSDARPLVLLSANFQAHDSGVITTNAGFSYDGISPKVQYNYTLTYTYSLNPKWAVFIEEYGNIVNDNHLSHVDTGLAYTFNKNTIFDLGIGTDINSYVDQTFVSLGVSWRAIP